MVSSCGSVRGAVSSAILNSSVQDMFSRLYHVAIPSHVGWPVSSDKLLCQPAHLPDCFPSAPSVAPPFAPLTVSSPRTFDAAMNLCQCQVYPLPRAIACTHMPPAYPPSPLIPSACTDVIRSRFSRSDMCAVNCASCAWRWESWRDLDAEVGTVERRFGAGVRPVWVDIVAVRAEGFTMVVNRRWS